MRVVLLALMAMIILLIGLIGAFPRESDAFVLPYTTRTQDYSSWTPATRGDANTIGMAGATVALPTSISSAETNPAGYAMTTGVVSAQINSATSKDQRLQLTGESATSSQWGFAVSPQHWGFALTYYSAQTETGTYVAPAIGDTAQTEVSLKEFRLTVARAFMDDSLSIGIVLEAAKGVREVNETSSSAWGPSYQLGALRRFGEHALIGASFAPELRVGPSPDPDPQGAIPGFNRAIVRPALLAVGAGWMPNRFFKAGTSLTYVGKTTDTALLSDQTVRTGTSASWVPRVGASYVVAEYANIKVEAAVGAYYESSRLSNQSDRVHLTAALDVNPSFINMGGSFDLAAGYRSYGFSVGVDAVRTARFFKIIPEETVPPYNGYFPSPTRVSPDGLPAGLTAEDPKKYEEQNVSEVGKIISDVPENLQKKLQGKKTTVEVEAGQAKKKPKPKKR